jgi:hypothetical protein
MRFLALERSAMLDEAQRAEFDRNGFVRLTGVFSAQDARAMRERIWAHLAEQHGVRRDDPTTWTIDQPRHFQTLSRGGAFTAIGSPVLTAACDDLLGVGAWQRPRRWGEPLVTFPRPGTPWGVPSATWHIDWPPRGVARPVFGLKVLAFLCAVPPEGGGTLVLSGSHRLVEHLVEDSPARDFGSSPRARGALARRHPWFRDLVTQPDVPDRTARLMDEETMLEGVPVRVVELACGEGEAVLVHPWLFHSAAPNCAAGPRLMLAQGIHTPQSIAAFARPDRRRAAAG